MYKHGMDGTKLYRVWSRMKERCNNKNNKSYKNYGGRGIKFCDEWNDFIPFMEWAFDNGYKEGLSLDRINVNGNYCPSNCRWITMFEQQSNKRNSRYVTINNQTKTVSQWANLCNIDRHTILYRLNRGEQGGKILRKGRKGGGWSEDDRQSYFNKICKD